MSTIPAAASVAVPRAGPLLRLGVLLAALAVAGCGGAGLASPAAPVATAAAARPAPAVSPPPSPVGSVRPPTDPAKMTPRSAGQPGPPVASLVVGGGAPIPGALGSYVWDGSGSDAPWLVPPASEGIRAGGPYAVTVVPPLPIERWEASWARVGGSAAGDPEGVAAGEGGRVSVPGPRLPGTWSLMMDIRFAGGNHAAWYWRIEVGP